VYSLGKKEGDIYIFVNNQECGDIKQQCFLLKNGNPLTNNLISIEALSFQLSNISDKNPKKVTINITARPAINKGLKTSDVLK
jgi:hypothetical protein